MQDEFTDNKRGGLEMAERGSYRWIGLALFVGVSWLYAASGLMAPIWAVGVLWVLWLGSLVY